MILASVTFSFIVQGETVKVSFRADKVRVLRAGKPPFIVQNGKMKYSGTIGQPLTSRPYWPCVTHCKDLIRQAMSKPAAKNDEHSRQRREAVKPKKLGVFKP